MIDLGTVNLYYEKKKVTVYLKDFNDTPHLAQVNFIRLFNAEHSLYVGGYTFIDKAPFDEGSGFYLFQIDMKTGSFKPIINLCAPPDFVADIDLIGSQVDNCV